tara:strand:- start:387 stop:1961 length:1575 start_codon:yes stop_codon:yes gene_type:complete
MKLDKVKEAFSSVFEEDDALKYALATNIAKYGRPQSKPSDKPAKLTKGLEKKREKAVKDLKKVMDEEINLVHVYDKDGKMFGTGERISSNNGKTLVRFDGSTEKEFDSSQVKNVSEQEGSSFPGPDMNNKGYIAARDLIDRLRSTIFKKLNDDELEEFRKTLANAFDFDLKERVVSDNESPSLKAKIAAEDFMRGYRTTLRRVEGNFGREAAEEFKEIVLRKFSQMNEAFSGFQRNPEDPDSEPFTPTGSVAQFREELESLFGKFKSNLKNPEFIRGVAEIMVNWKSLLRSQLNEDEGTLNKIADMLSRKFDDLDFDVNTMSDRIDVRGSQQDLLNFGSELHGKKIFDYEVFHTDDDDRGEIVRIVKSDSISRGGVNEATVDYDFSERELIRVLRQLKRGASTEVDMIRAFTKALGREITDDELMREEQTMQGNPNLKMGTYAGRKVIVNTMGTEDMTKWKAIFLNTGKKVDFADVVANIKLDEKAKKADRCLRIARRKMPQSSAYRSGLIVKCRKGMIWKKEK